MTLIRPLKNPQMLRWLLLTACILLFLSMPALAQTAGGTANPLSGISIGSGDNKNLSSMFGFFIKLIIVSIPFVIMIYTFSDAILSIFSGLRQAIRDGNIGAFFFNLMIILIGVGLSLFLGFYMFDLVGKFDSYWPKSS